MSMITTRRTPNFLIKRLRKTTEGGKISHAHGLVKLT
jgi:hypothetical protein